MHGQATIADSLGARSRRHHSNHRLVAVCLPTVLQHFPCLESCLSINDITKRCHGLWKSLNSFAGRFAQALLQYYPGAMANALIRNARLSIYALGSVGILGTWGRGALDGTLRHLVNALHSQEGEPYILPGSGHPIREKFTGIYPIDYLLKASVIFFWEAVNGLHPPASMNGMFYISQLCSIILVFYLNSSREGQKVSLIRYVMYLLFRSEQEEGNLHCLTITFIAAAH